MLQRALSTRLFVNHRLTTAWLDKLSRTRIPAVEIFCARQHFDYHNRAQIAELGHWFRDATLELHSLHAPIYTDDVWGVSGPQAFINISEVVKSRRIAMLDEIKRTLEVAETIPFRYLVQHLGGNDEEYDERKVDAAFSSLEEICLFAKQRGVEVLIENTPGAMTTSERLRIFIEQTHLNLHFCFDVVHAHHSESIPSAFQSMKERIRSVHIHDTDGKNDHLFPLREGDACSIDWTETMRMLAPRAGQYSYVLEINEVPDLANPFQAAAEVFDKLQNLSNPGESE
ncbi:MAG: sugar phosphate isomerase/epimerase [Bryobacteraceae bacterium]